MRRTEEMVKRRLWSTVRTACAGLVLLIAVFSFPAAAQLESMEDISADGLLNRAAKYLNQGQYAAAVPYLKEYVARMEFLPEARVQARVQEVRLKLGKISAFMADSETAVTYLNEYVGMLPLYKPREAYKLLALNLNQIARYQECITAATNALARPLPQGMKEEKQTVDYEEMTKKDRGGFSARKLARWEEEEEESKAEIDADFSGDRPDEEPDYSEEELVLLYMALGDSYAAMEQWEEALEPYQFVIDHSKDEQRTGVAILQMVNALIKLERYEEAGTFVSQLYRTNARYDIRVNMALINAGVALFEAEQYDSALKLYRMVLPRWELIAYQEKKMNDIRRDNVLPDVIITVTTNETGRIQTLFGERDDISIIMQEQRKSDKPAEPVKKPDELVRLEELVATLVTLEPYEEDVLYYSGHLYATVKRLWEAVVTLDVVTSRDPDGQRGERAFTEALMALVDLEEYDRAESRATAYLKDHVEGLVPRQVAYALTICYQRQERWRDIKSLRPVIDGFVLSTDLTVRQYECELYYMQAVADMMLTKYNDARKGFKKVLTDYANGREDQNAAYWHAMCGVLLQEYETAMDEFGVFVEQYPGSTWEPNAVFQIGVCLFSTERYDESQQKFTKVIETWPDSNVYPDACSMRGDVFASKGGDNLDLAEKDYREAIAAASAVKQATYPVFQMCTMFELERRFEETLAVVDDYLAAWGDEADIAKAIFWKGKTYLAQGNIDDAIEAYRSTIFKYGADARQEGVDMIISELTTVARRLSPEKRGELMDSLQDSLRNSDSVTLKLRLRVLIATINGTLDELGKELLTEVTDLTQAPPPVLSVLCDASFANRDYSRSGEILDIFQAQYESSEFMNPVLKLRAYGLLESGDYEGVLKMTSMAQDIYGGTAPNLAWAQMMKGRVELEFGQFADAEDTFAAVLALREWRGEPYAEATYRLGELYERAGNPRQAFGFYQRAYFQYKGYANGYWAAEGYLASARCLEKMGLINDMRNTYRAMLFDRFVNTLPQAETAREVLGPSEVLEIQNWIEQGVQTNFTVTVEAEIKPAPAAEPAVENSAAPESVNTETAAPDEPAESEEQAEQMPEAEETP